VKLNGLPPNTEWVGARVTITIGNKAQMRELSVGRILCHRTLS